MRKRTIALVAFLLTGTLFTACGSESNVETATSEFSEEADTSAEESPADTETADTASAPAVDPEEEYKNGYDYLLYYDSEINEGTRDYPVILGFNYPYKADSKNNSAFAPSRYDFDTKYTEVIDSVPCLATDYFTITSKQYEITSDNKLIYTAPNFTGEQDDTDVEEKGEVETPYGTAKIYFARTHEEGFDDRCREVALLNTGDYTVTLTWGSSGDLEEYSGTLETLIPLVSVSYTHLLCKFLQLSYRTYSTALQISYINLYHFLTGHLTGVGHIYTDGQRIRVLHGFLIQLQIRISKISIAQSIAEGEQDIHFLEVIITIAYKNSFLILYCILSTGEIQVGGIVRKL